MSDSAPLLFTPVELESYLPAGWILASADGGSWDPEEGVYRFRVLDGSDLEWDVTVDSAEVEAHGRIEALRRAIDELERQRFRGFLG